MPRLHFALGQYPPRRAANQCQMAMANVCATGCVGEQPRQRQVKPIADEPPHAGRIPALPVRIDGKRDLGGPAGHRAGRQQDRIAHRLIAAATPIEHPGQHRHVQIGIIVDLHLALAVVQSMQRPAYWAIVPRQETGRVRNKVSSRGSSKPSPMYLPVASKTRSSFSGMAARRARMARHSLGPHRREAPPDAESAATIVAFGQHQGRAALSGGPGDFLANQSSGHRQRQDLHRVQLSGHVRTCEFLIMRVSLRFLMHHVPWYAIAASWSRNPSPRSPSRYMALWPPSSIIAPRPKPRSPCSARSFAGATTFIRVASRVARRASPAIARLRQRVGAGPVRKAEGQMCRSARIAASCPSPTT